MIRKNIKMTENSKLYQRFEKYLFLMTSNNVIKLFLKILIVFYLLYVYNL